MEANFNLNPDEEIQSILFNKKSFSKRVTEAMMWKNKLKVMKRVQTTTNFYRHIIKPPKKKN